MRRLEDILTKNPIVLTHKDRKRIEDFVNGVNSYPFPQNMENSVYEKIQNYNIMIEDTY